MAARSRQHCFARQQRRLAQSSQQFFSSTADQQGTGLTNTNLGPNFSLTRAMPCCAPTFADQPGTATTSWCSTVATGAEQNSKPGSLSRIETLWSRNRAGRLPARGSRVKRREASGRSSESHCRLVRQASEIVHKETI